MTQVISVRLPSEKVAAIDRRATESGLNRTKYLMLLVDEDLAQRRRQAKRRFASTHLLGRFQSKGSSNSAVRSALKTRSEEDR
jgi:hypothetical protein